MIPEKVFEKAFEIESWITREQGKILFALAQNAIGKIAELGSWKGRSTLILVAGALTGKKQKVFCIDTWKNCDLKPYFNFFPEWKKNIKTAEIENYCVPIIQDTQVAAKQFGSSEFGLIFVDAWHTRIAVENDFKAWWNRLIPEKGKMVFHDCTKGFPEIQEFISWLETQKQFGKIEKVEGMAILTRTKEED